MIDKIIEELTELRNGFESNCHKYINCDECSQYDICTDCSLSMAIEIVKKYENDGWILCSDELPLSQELVSTNFFEQKQYVVKRKTNRGVEGYYDYDVARYLHVYEDGFYANGMALKDVVEWHELPRPYKGE